MSYAEDAGYDAYDGLVGTELQVTPKEARDDVTWVTKDKRIIKVIKMSDDHLFNAYMISGNEALFKEMVYRVFENKLRGS